MGWGRDGKRMLPPRPHITLQMSDVRKARLLEHLFRHLSPSPRLAVKHDLLISGALQVLQACRELRMGDIDGARNMASPEFLRRADVENDHLSLSLQSS